MIVAALHGRRLLLVLDNFEQSCLPRVEVGPPPGRFPGLSDLLEDVCLRPFEVTVRQGPNEGQEYLGALAIKLSDGGAIEEGYFEPPMAMISRWSGRPRGRSISMLITLADGQTVYGVGVGEQEVGACAGQMGGPLVGPEPGDMGDWAVLDLAIQPGRAAPRFAGMPSVVPDCFGSAAPSRPDRAYAGSLLAIRLLRARGLHLAHLTIPGRTDSRSARKIAPLFRHYDAHMRGGIASCTSPRSSF